MGVIFGNSSPALVNCCQDLGFDIIETGGENKLPKLREICERLRVNNESVAFCGDDVQIIRQCGLSVSPNDAHQLAIDAASWVSEKKEGKGLFETLSIIYRCLNLTSDYLKCTNFY